MIKTNPLPLLKLSLMAGLLLLVSACSKQESDIATYVPEGVAVIAIDFNRLDDKVKTATLRENMMVKIFELTTMQQGLPNFLENKAITGLDFNREFLLFMREGDAGTAPFIVARIDDKSQFQKFLNQMAGEGSVFDTLGIKLASSSPFSLGWKDDVVIIAFEDALDQIPAIFQEKREEASTQVRDLISREKDIVAYLPANGSEQVTNLLPLPAALRNQNLPLEWLSLDFQNGLATVEGSFAPVSNENMRNWLHMPGTDLLNSLPGGNPYGYMVIGAKWQQLQQVFATSGNTSGNYSDLLDRISQIAGDEVAIGLYGAEPDGLTPTFVGAFDLKENAASTMAGWQGENLQLAGDNRFLITAQDTFVVLLDGNRGFFTNDENLLTSTGSLEWSGLDTDIDSPVQLMIHVDGMVSSVDPRHPVTSYEAFLRTLRIIKFTASQEGDVLQFELEASFQNQDENSLEQLVKAFNATVAGGLPF